MCMLDIVRVCFRVRHILKQYFKLFILTEIRANEQTEAKKNGLQKTQSVFLCDLKVKLAFG